MQIHELNNKSKQINEQQVNEVDLVGPNSIWNVGKEVIKNPSALLTNRSLGAAKQTAYQSSAADSATKLAAKQGFTAGASNKQQTTQQILANVKTNPGIQQAVKNLVAQWKSVGPNLVAGLKAKTQQPANSASTTGYSKVTTNAPTAAVPQVAEELMVAQPNTTRDPVVKNTLSGLYSQAQQPAATSNIKYNVPASAIAMPSQQGAYSVKPQANTTRQVDSNIVSISNDFKRWANTKLANLKISLADSERDPWAKEQLEQLLLKIATLSLADPSAQATNSAIEDFFNVAYAANIAIHQNDQAVGSAGRVSSGATASQQQNDKEIIQQSGVPLTQTQIDTLGAAIRKDLDGNRVIRNTGSPLLNAIARAAGLQIGR